MAKTERKGELTTRPEPGSSPASLFDEFDRLFGEFGRRGWLNPFALEFPRHPGVSEPFEGKTPKVDVIDRDSELVVHAELPGVEKDDIDITVSDRSVTIRASTKHEKEEKKEEERYYRREISRGEFSRTLALPVAVDEERATATFAHGVLELTLPKQEEKPAHRAVKVE